MVRSAMWRQAINRFVLPHLPDTWRLNGILLYREPSDWILCSLILSNSRWSSDFRLDTTVKLLAVPTETLGGRYVQPLGHGTGRSLWATPTTVAELAPAMGDILDHINTEAVPLFDRLGSIDGYTADTEQRAAEIPQDVISQEELTYLRLLRGDLAGALSAAEAADRAGHSDGRDWAVERALRVRRIAEIARDDLDAALAVLRDNVTYTRTKIKLPPPATPHQGPLPDPHIG